MTMQLTERRHDRDAERRAPQLDIPDLRLPEFLLGAADTRGRMRALVDARSGRELSYGELAAAVRAVGAGLCARDVCQGEVVALCAHNSIEFVVSWLAAALIGAVVTTLNPSSTGAELTKQLTQSGARRLLTTRELHAEKLRDAAKASGIAESYLIGGSGKPSPRAMAFDDLAAESELPPFDLSPRDVAFLPFSSGTSGLPKGVVLTHRNLVANLCQMRPVHRLTPDDVVIAVLPLFHIFGFQVTLNLALRAGATVVMLPRFEPAEFLRAIQTYGVTRAEVVPPIVLALAGSELVDRYDLASLRTVTAGAAPLGADLARACEARIGCRVKQGFGMTELGGGTHIVPDDGSDKPDSIGPALPGVECRVVDPESGLDLAPNEPGELWMRSPSMMRGYLDDAAATAATIDADGWLHTGDIVTVDEDGWFRVADRIKELIKYKGFQVAPAELEDVLLTHPAVADAAVVRSPDEQAGEVPKAFVVARAPVSADELTTWVAERVARYKRIRRVEFVEQIPKSASGKILRRLLADRELSARALDLTGKVVLVSGGGRGLGRLVARTLAGAGAAVGLLARSPGELASAVAQIEQAGGCAAAAAVDVTERPGLVAAVHRLRDVLGPVDVLINNAGIAGPAGAMWDVDPDEWWRTFEVNLGGAAALTNVVLPDMIARGRGRILNITSHAGVYRWPLVSAYAASKAALVKLTETLAVEARPHGVTVLSVDPGLLPIGLGDPARDQGADPDSPAGRVFGWIQRRLEAGYGAEPEQSARFIVELAAGRGDRLSGRHLSVSDDLQPMLERIERIEADDLHTLRLRTAA
jgi:acyl-CoA synthetase (AMP-forming)/AMP-acid ligase II/NAD(P)-dependent dehydrogenase (short-subunit alcohol dehydrogenase family)